MARTAPAGGREVVDRVVPHRIVESDLSAGDALAVATAVHALGMDTDHIAEALSTAEPVSAGRFQVLERGDGVTIINDVFNANTESMRAGVEALTSLAGDRRTVAVLGEMKELGDTAKAAHAEVGRLVGDLGIDVLVTVGTTDEMTALAKAARLSSPRRIESADDPNVLLPLLNRLLTSGDVVLVKASKSVGLEKFTHPARRSPGVRRRSREGGDS